MRPKSKIYTPKRDYEHPCATCPDHCYKVPESHEAVACPGHCSFSCETGCPDHCCSLPTVSTLLMCPSECHVRCCELCHLYKEKYDKNCDIKTGLCYLSQNSSYKWFMSYFCNWLIFMWMLPVAHFKVTASCFPPKINACLICLHVMYDAKVVYTKFFST